MLQTVDIWRHIETIHHRFAAFKPVDDIGNRKRAQLMDACGNKTRRLAPPPTILCLVLSLHVEDTLQIYYSYLEIHLPDKLTTRPTHIVCGVWSQKRIRRARRT
jgi:hypothetical protein